MRIKLNLFECSNTTVVVVVARMPYSWRERNEVITRRNTAAETERRMAVQETVIFTLLSFLFLLCSAKFPFSRLFVREASKHRTIDGEKMQTYFWEKNRKIVTAEYVDLNVDKVNMSGRPCSPHSTQAHTRIRCMFIFSENCRT